jgi:hypothetical protein
MTNVRFLTVMDSLVLIDRRDLAVVAQVRLRDRVAARWRSLALDRELAAGAPPEATAALTLRARKLVGPAARAALAGGLRKALARTRRRPGVGLRLPVREHAVIEAADDLARLADRLVARAPVAARGVAQTCLLLSDGAGPLYDGGRGDLGAAVRDAIAGLEPQP